MKRQENENAHRVFGCQFRCLRTRSDGVRRAEQRQSPMINDFKISAMSLTGKSIWLPGCVFSFLELSSSPFPPFFWIRRPFFYFASFLFGATRASETGLVSPYSGSCFFENKIELFLFFCINESNRLILAFSCGCSEHGDAQRERRKNRDEGKRGILNERQRVKDGFQEQNIRHRQFVSISTFKNPFQIRQSFRCLYAHVKFMRSCVFYSRIKYLYKSPSSSSSWS